MFCKRCGSRVVSNVSHCPYCGKSLLPLIRRFWFWSVIVCIVGAAVALLLFYPPNAPTVEEPVEVPAPFVVGAPEGTSLKGLQVETTVDCNTLNVTVVDYYQENISSNGEPITAVEVRFFNSGPSPVILYSTQWQMESADGTRVDCFIGKTAEGDSIRSELETVSLGPGSTYTTTLYFAVESPSSVVYAPNALSYIEDELITWNLASVSPDS